MPSPSPQRRPRWWQRLRPRGLRFSFVGSVFLLFTGTTGFLMVKFPMFNGLKVMFGLMLVINTAFFVQFREKKKKSLFDRMMAHRFFPRKLAFTNEGKFLVLISIGMGFAAVNTGSNLLYLLLGMLLSIIMASGILSEFSVQKVSWTADLPANAVAGEETLFTLRVTNDKRRLNSFSLEGEVMLADDSSASVTRGSLLKLQPGRSDFLFCRVLFPRRGLHGITGVSLGTSYPFSFFRKSRNFQLEREVVVVPRGEHDVDSVVFALATGFEENANKAGRGSEFFSVRPMHAGDEWRDVHWKQSAKLDSFAVREYEALTTRRVFVRLARDEMPALLDPDSEEEAIEIAASVVKRLALSGFEVGLAAPGTLIMPLAGNSAVRQIFVTLALLDLEKTRGEKTVVPGLEPGSRDILVTVDLDTRVIEVAGSDAAAPRRFSAGGAA